MHRNTPERPTKASKTPSLRGLNSLPQTATVLRISLNELQELVQSKRIGCVRVGHRLMISDAQMAEYVHGHNTGYSDSVEVLNAPI